jgi:ComF family protein
MRCRCSHVRDTREGAEHAGQSIPEVGRGPRQQEVRPLDGLRGSAREAGGKQGGIEKAWLRRHDRPRMSLASVRVKCFTPRMDDGANAPAAMSPGLLARLGGLVRAFGAATLDAAYPPQCLACRTIVAEAASLCPACWRATPFISRPYCERLGTPFAVDLGGPLISPAAMADPPVFERARAVARHDGIARDLVHRLKFNDRQELAIGMGRMMASAAREIVQETDVVIPLPLHWTRLWQRRFNQSAALAEVLARHTGTPLERTWLVRRKRTRRQVGLSRSERQQNLQGAFVVTDAARPLLTGRRVLLVDDVMTTGSSANAAARALLKGGATAVDVVTFSRVAVAP